jgi:aminoglycoside phosphotransferase (APT) family kinase protein
VPDSDLEPRLAAVVSEALGAKQIEIRELVRMSGGASRQTWSFDAVADGQQHELILRLAGANKAEGDLMLMEAAAMTEAARVGVPEPEVLAAQGDDSVLDGPFVIMQRIDGETIARRILRNDEYAAARPLLASQCGTILARLHTMNIDALPNATELDALAVFHDVFVASGVVSSPLELAFKWLQDNKPAATRRTVVHGDFRHGNLIVGPDGIRAVLDWELVHLGDPMEDLGWLCTRAWRFGGKPPVGGFGEYADLFAAYEAESGLAIDPEVVAWWELYGTVKWGVICISQAGRHLGGGERSVELAAIGRRLYEQEYDIVMLLRDRLGANV